MTVVTVGGEDAEKQLRTALAMGCDRAVLLNVEDDLEEWDQYSASTILYHYLKDKEASLILAGNVAIDGGSGQVAPRLAELLGFSYVTTITSIQIDGGSVSIERDAEGMWKSFLPNSRLSSQLSKDSMSLAIHHYQAL